MGRRYSASRGMATKLARCRWARFSPGACGRGGYAARRPVARYFFLRPSAFTTPARVAADLPACFAAEPADFAAVARPLAAPLAADFASPAAPVAALP